MNKLWTFGDSFTAGNGTFVNEEYNKYKQPGEAIWPVLLSEKLNMELVNRGYGLFSNDKIIDTIMENYNLIKPNDLVIIGKTWPGRIDIPNKANDTLLTIAPSHFWAIDNSKENYSRREMDFFLKLVILFNSKLIEERQNFRFDFLKKLIEKKTNCIIWEHSQFFLYETIKDATNGLINDLHWSYKGHSDFLNYIVKKIDTNKKQII